MATRELDIDGQKRSYFDQLAWAGPATLNGLPATTAPIGRTDTGLPIGVQIIGGFLTDRTTIAFAGMVEREFGGFTPPPVYFAGASSIRRSNAPYASSRACSMRMSC